MNLESTLRRSYSVNMKGLGVFDLNFECEYVMGITICCGQKSVDSLEMKSIRWVFKGYA